MVVRTVLKIDLRIVHPRTVKKVVKIASFEGGTPAKIPDFFRVFEPKWLIFRA